MADDIRVDVGFLRNLKTAKLSKALGGNMSDPVVCMIRLWLYCSERHKKGTLNGMDKADLETAAGWTGMPGAFAEHAIGMRWVDESPDGSLSIHDWVVHQPYIYHFDLRSERGRVGAKARWHKIPNEENQALNATGNAGGNAPAPAPAPAPDQDLPNSRTARAPQVDLKSTSSQPKPPPTIGQVVDYCRERKNNVDPERFHAYYTAIGWMVGKNPMRNWKAAVVTWERNDQAKSAKTKPPVPVDCVGRELKTTEPKTPVDFTNPTHYAMVKALDSAGINTDHLETLHALKTAFEQHRIQKVGG